MDVHRYACLWDLVCCSLCCRLSTQNGNNLLEMFLFAPLVRCQSLRNKFARTLFQCIFHWNPTRAKSTSRNHILCHSMLTRMMLFASFFSRFSSFDFPTQNTFSLHTFRCSPIVCAHFYFSILHKWMHIAIFHLFNETNILTR